MSILSRAKSAHRGERSLGETYWLWLVLPAAAERLVLALISFNSLSLVLSIGLSLYDVIVVSVQALYLAWLYYFGAGVLKSARTAESKFWAGLAVALVWISFVISPLIVLKNFSDAFSIGGSSEDILAELPTLNAQLPKRLDSATTLEKMSYSEKTVTYRYIIDQKSVGKINWATLTQNVLKNQCPTFDSEFKSGSLSSVQDEYFSESGQALQTIEVTHHQCEYSKAMDSAMSSSGNLSLSSKLDAMNAQLPKQIDAITTLERIEFRDKVLRYKYVIDPTNSAMDWGKQREALLQSGCPIFKRDLADGSVNSVDYDYSDKSGVTLKSIALATTDCP